MRVFSEENSKVLLCVAFGRTMEEVRAFTTGIQCCEKEACEKLVRKSIWCFVKAWISNGRNIVYISAKLNLNNFETESQMFTVIAVHKILVLLGVPG